MSCDSYIETGSILHRWDGRQKLIVSMLCIAAAAWVRSGTALIACGTLALLLMQLSRIPVSRFFRLLQYPALMSLVMSPLLWISSGGEPLYRFGPMHVYREGVYWSIIITARSLIIVMFFGIVFMTEKTDRVFKAMELLGVPQRLVFIFLTTCRFIFQFLEILETMGHAARLRGFSLARGMFHMRTLAQILLSLLVRGFEQTERTSRAMRLRGQGDRLVLVQGFSATLSDAVLTVLILGCVAGIAAVEVL